MDSRFRWIGILFVITGLTTVGVCDLLYQQNQNGTDPHPNASKNFTIKRKNTGK
jgi:hypothetical protein